MVRQEQCVDGFVMEMGIRFVKYNYIGENIIIH